MIEEQFDIQESTEEKEEKSASNKFEALSIEEEYEEEENKEDSNPVTGKATQPSLKPTRKEIEEEERCFAISLVLWEISEIRKDVRNIWDDCARDLEVDVDTATFASNLCAATACTEYTSLAVTKLVNQTSLRVKSFDDLDQILRSFGDVKMQTSELSVGDVMVISGLQSQTALNGQEGVVT